ncbi:hypothetical protein DJ64_00205 [Streptomyces griseorubens]|uniref:Transposase n=1 Tax=Streptomyces griseorubens TaxID=66897 RepID=A0ABR4TAD8_9ACTN|nr:hypothetical protein DJ64_00205 [Streptomyces griseorubens]
MDRHEEDVDARIRGGLTRSSQDGAPLREACRQQGVERTLEDVCGQTARDLHRLPLGGGSR